MHRIIFGEEFSNVKNYSKYAKESILEMQKQVGKPQFDRNGILKKGVIVRHLILPNHTKNTIEVLDWLCENLQNEVVVSLMAQYFPTYKAKNNPNLNRKITKREYEKVEQYLFDKNFKYGYIQELRRT